MNCLLLLANIEDDKEWMRKNYEFFDKHNPGDVVDYAKHFDVGNNDDEVRP